MTLTWIIQGNPQTPERCARCQQIIHPLTYFFRACGNQDGGDEFGYNVCFVCRKLLPKEPPAREAFA